MSRYRNDANLVWLVLIVIIAVFLTSCGEPYDVYDLSAERDGESRYISTYPSMYECGLDRGRYQVRNMEWRHKCTMRTVTP